MSNLLSPSLSAAFAMLLVVLPIQAQDGSRYDRSNDVVAGHTATEPEAIHITDTINRHPAAQAARASLADRQAPSLLGKTTASYRIGQKEVFMVYNVEASNHGADVQLDPIGFTLMADGERFRLWIETTEIENGHVRSADVASLHAALSRQTPARSVAPSAGILENDEMLFGSPPDVDGDGATDVLLVDIRDGYEPGKAFVAGFVWHGDLDTQGKKGNGRDVLYIDTNPGIFRDGAPQGTHRAEATAAHEYQHLIHIAYDRDELTFVNEGLSEWAAVANGYEDHPVTYLRRPSRHGTGLLDWHDYEPNLRRSDYERARLFTTYLAQCVGAERMRLLVQARSGGQALKGADGYQALLDASGGAALADVVMDFHTANFLNDRGIDPNYGYEDPVLQSLKVVPTQSFSGRDAKRTDGLKETLRPGAVSYLSWRHVADFEFRTATGDGSTALRIRALAEHADGRVEVRTFAAGGTTRSIQGDFKRVTLAVVHTDLYAGPASVSVDAVWKEGGTSGISFETLQYDDGEAAAFFNLSGAADAAQASRFVVPEGDAALERISIAPYFSSQFSGTFLPEDAARDLDVRIWKARPDGRPGEELLSIPVEDPRPFAAATYDLRFFDVDLAPYAATLSILPDTIFVGIVDAGTDANHLVAAASAYTPESVSYTGNVAAGTWKRLWDVQLFGSEDPYPMRGTAIPIRVEFVVRGEASDRPDNPELPSIVTLDQNYPNPFNPSSTIQYHLEETVPVRLAIYDAAGRQVALLADGLRSAGTHRVDVDAARWASGVYVYALEAGGRRMVRTMVLAK